MPWNASPQPMVTGMGMAMVITTSISRIRAEVAGVGLGAASGALRASAHPMQGWALTVNRLPY
jgi:hypothetical protein